jgi:hypothetical protein
VGFCWFAGVVWVDYLGCLLGVALGCFSWFVWVLLVSLSLFWVHLSVLSYTFCIIGWRLLNLRFLI